MARVASVGNVGNSGVWSVGNVGNVGNTPAETVGNAENSVFRGCGIEGKSRGAEPGDKFSKNSMLSQGVGNVGNRSAMAGELESAMKITAYLSVSETSEKGLFLQILQCAVAVGIAVGKVGVPFRGPYVSYALQRVYFRCQA